MMLRIRELVPGQLVLKLFTLLQGQRSAEDDEKDKINETKPLPGSSLTEILREVLLPTLHKMSQIN